MRLTMKTIDDFSLFTIILGMTKIRMKIYKVKYCFLALLLFMVGGCAGEVFGSVDDYRTVVTVRNDTAAFNLQSVKTYQIIPDVLELSEPSARRVAVEHVRDAVIIDELEVQLEEANLQNIEDLADAQTGALPTPDIIVFASIVAQSSWDYDGPVSYTAPLNGVVDYSGAPEDMSYDVESVIITMVNPTQTVPGHPAWYRAIWTAGIHNTYTDMTETTVRTGIATAFEQSPYISQPAVAGGVK
jgi:hypothetical protein